MRAVRRRRLRRPVHVVRTRRGRPAPGAPRDPARLGLRRSPSGGGRSEPAALRGASSATTRPPAATSARGCLGHRRRRPPRLRAAPAAPARPAGRRARPRAPRSSTDACRSPSCRPGAARRLLYPSVDLVASILDELEARFPDAVFTFVGRLRAEGARTASGITRRRGRPSPRSATAVDRRVRPADPRAARGRRGVEPLRLAAHGLRLRRRRRRHAVAHALGGRLARVLLQRRPVPLGPPEGASTRPAFARGRTLPLSTPTRTEKGRGARR